MDVVSVSCLNLQVGRLEDIDRLLRKTGLENADPELSSPVSRDIRPLGKPTSLWPVFPPPFTNPSPPVGSTVHRATQ